jgi:hypothetical protein
MLRRERADSSVICLVASSAKWPEPNFLEAIALQFLDPNVEETENYLASLKQNVIFFYSDYKFPFSEHLCLMC